jgi:serine/threonine protein kinase
MVKGELQSALADRYTIERELGRGGMATVYLAQDVRPDRPVARKVREGRRALEMLPISRDAYFGAHLQLQLVRIYVLVGQSDQALEARAAAPNPRSTCRPAGSGSIPSPMPCGTTRFRKLVEGAA